MYKRKTHYSYLINIPPYAAREIINWFETMSANGCLSEELIGMVFENLCSDLNSDPLNANNCTVNKITPITARANATTNITPKAALSDLPHIKAETLIPVTNTACPSHNTVTLKSDTKSEEAPGFLDNLYDWEGANSAMTNDEGSGMPLGVKKKMLSV